VLRPSVSSSFLLFSYFISAFSAVEVSEQATVPVEPSPSGPSESEAIDQSTPSRPPPPPKAPPPAPVASDATLNTRLQMSLQELELRRSQLERSKTTLANLQAKHDALQVELDAGRIRETASATTIVQLQHDIDALKREKDALRDQVNMMGESSRLGEQAVVARLELSTAKEAMQQLEAKYHTATSGISLFVFHLVNRAFHSQ
jgi:FtsZ-binding cell division protein ZapB